jgi:MFS family permease
MKKLLSRLSWVLSFCLAFVLLEYLLVLSDGDNILRYLLKDSEMLVVNLVIILVLTALVKVLFFPKRMIEAVFKKGVKITSKQEAEERVQTKKQNLKQEKPESIPAFKSDTIFTQAAKTNSVVSSDLKNRKQQKTAAKSTQELPQKPNRIKKSKPGIIKQFFAEHTLAKIGGILLFLGVLFLLQLVYTNIGQVGKVAIGFAIGFAVYSVGLFLEQKKLPKEARVLLGTGILINYLVILAGRYLIGDNPNFVDTGFFSNDLAFILLILNTLFACFTALVFHSQALLFFSFIAAYANPFLLDLELVGFTTLIGYNSILTLGSLALVYFVAAKKTYRLEEFLLVIYILANLFVIFVASETNQEWLTNVLASGVTMLLTLGVALKIKLTRYLTQIFALAYFFLYLHILQGQFLANDFINSDTALIGYLSLLAIFFATNLVITIKNLARIALLTLMAPIFLGLSLFIFTVPSLLATSWLIAIIVPLALAGFFFTYSLLAKWLRFLYLAAIAALVLVAEGYSLMLVLRPALAGEGSFDLPFINTLVLFLVAIAYLLSAYYYSSKRDMEYFYPLASFLSALIILPLIRREGEVLVISIIFTALYFVINFAWPLLNHNLAKFKPSSVIIGTSIGALFATWQLYYFGQEYFPGVSLGIYFTILAVAYFLVGYMQFVVFDLSLDESEKLNGNSRELLNLIYAYLGLATAILALAIVFLFGETEELIVIVWLLIASVIYFFYSKVSESKIYYAGSVILAIGTWRLGDNFSSWLDGELITLIPLVVVLLFALVNTWFLQNFKNPLRYLADGLQALLISLATYGIFAIIDHEKGFSLLTVAAVLVLVSLVASRFYSGLLKYFYLAAAGFIYAGHFMSLDATYRLLEETGENQLKIIQLVIAMVLALGAYIFSTYKHQREVLGINLILIAVYSLAITTKMVYYFFEENVFVITIYWAIIAFSFLAYGISQELLKFRTLGLNILLLTLGKIVLYDIWAGIDSGIVRVLALILVGGLMILISVLYSKKYAGNLAGEFNPQNLFAEKSAEG